MLQLLVKTKKLDHCIKLFPNFSKDIELKGTDPLKF